MSNLSVFSLSKYSAPQWEPVLNCLNSWKPVDDVTLQLWDHSPDTVDLIARINPRWTISTHEDNHQNTMFNIWNARCVQLRSFIESGRDFGLIIEDDIRLNGRDLRVKTRRDELAVLRETRKQFDPWEIGYMANGIVMSREVAEAIHDDFCRGPVAHEDRFFILLAYLHGFPVRSIPSTQTRHLSRHEKNDHHNWTYEDKASDGLTHYGEFSACVDSPPLGTVGRPRLSKVGIDIAAAARIKRNES